MDDAPPEITEEGWEQIAAGFSQYDWPGLRSHYERLGDNRILATLVMYGKDRELSGIVRSISLDVPKQGGFISIWVPKSKRRRGIGSDMLMHACCMWYVNLDEQVYTKEGRALLKAYLAKGRPTKPLTSEEIRDRIYNNPDLA